MRRVAIAVAVLVLAAAGAVGASTLLTARDEPAVRRDAGPGVPRAALGPVARSAPATTPGNVLLLYADERDAPALRALAADVAGPPDPALAAAGQAVLVRRSPDVGHGVVALSHERGLRTDDPTDPRLRAFVETWLGRAGEGAG